MISCKNVFIGNIDDNLGKDRLSLIDKMHEFPNYEYFILIDMFNKYEIKNNELIFDENYINNKINILTLNKVFDKRYGYLILKINNYNDRVFYEFGMNELQFKYSMTSVNEWIIKRIIE